MNSVLLNYTIYHFIYSFKLFLFCHELPNEVLLVSV